MAPITATFAKEEVFIEQNEEALALHEQQCFGVLSKDKTLQLSLIEALYLFEKGKLTLIDGRNNPVDRVTFQKKATKQEANFFARYCVFKDFRDRGYIVKTALKFGADFRVYDRGIKPGQDHARWIVYPVKETTGLTWYEFAAKNRVAHSTKKRLMMGIVDEEGDVTYYEVKWMRP